MAQNMRNKTPLVLVKYLTCDGWTYCHFYQHTKTDVPSLVYCCDVLLRNDKMWPDGYYDCTLLTMPSRRSPRLKLLQYYCENGQIIDLKKRGLYFHEGNYLTDSKGCALQGYATYDKAMPIKNSQAAIKRSMTQLSCAEMYCLQVYTLPYEINPSKYEIIDLF